MKNVRGDVWQQQNRQNKDTQDKFILDQTEINEWAD